MLGALADSVQEVIELDPKSIEPPPRIGTRDEQFVMLLDINRVLTDEELRQVGEEAAQPPPPVVPDPAAMAAVAGVSL